MRLENLLLLRSENRHARRRLLLTFTQPLLGGRLAQRLDDLADLLCRQVEPPRVVLDRARTRLLFLGRLARQLAELGIESFSLADVRDLEVGRCRLRRAQLRKLLLDLGIERLGQQLRDRVPRLLRLAGVDQRRHCPRVETGALHQLRDFLGALLTQALRVGLTAIEFGAGLVDELELPQHAIGTDPLHEIGDVLLALHELGVDAANLRRLGDVGIAEACGLEQLRELIAPATGVLEVEQRLDRTRIGTLRVGDRRDPLRAFLRGRLCACELVGARLRVVSVGGHHLRELPPSQPLANLV